MHAWHTHSRERIRDHTGCWSCLLPYLRQDLFVFLLWMPGLRANKLSGIFLSLPFISHRNPGIIDTLAVAPGFHTGSGASNSGPHACVPAPLSTNLLSSSSMFSGSWGKGLRHHQRKNLRLGFPSSGYLELVAAPPGEQRHLANQKNQSVNKGLWSAY